MAVLRRLREYLLAFLRVTAAPAFVPVFATREVSQPYELAGVGFEPTTSGL